MSHVRVRESIRGSCVLSNLIVSLCVHARYSLAASKCSFYPPLSPIETPHDEFRPSRFCHGTLTPPRPPPQHISTTHH